MASLKELLTDAERILGEGDKVVVGRRDALALGLVAILPDGSRPAEDFPALAPAARSPPCHLLTSRRHEPELPPARTRRA